MTVQPQPRNYNNTNAITISQTQWEAALASEKVRHLARYLLDYAPRAKERFEWAFAQAQAGQQQAQAQAARPAAHHSQPKPSRGGGGTRQLSLAEFYAVKHLVANPWLLDQPLPTQFQAEPTSKLAE